MHRPWHRIDPALVRELGPYFEGAEEEALALLGVSDAATVANFRVGTRQALRRFQAEAGRPEAERDRSLFVLHGRLQQAGGRDLDEMLRFYRESALVLWRRASALAVARDVPAGVVAALAEAVFAFVDDLAAAAAQGFRQAEADATVAADARRRQLLRALVAGAPEGELEEAAALARWPVPARLDVLVAPAARADELQRRVAPHGLVDVVEEHVVALVAAPSREVVVAAALAEDVAPGEVPRAVRRATALLALATTDALLRVADHRADLLLLADPELARELAAARLAPLDALAPGRRARLLETLDAWLAHPGRPQAMADVLHLHVQTVRYRLGVLRELLGGDALDDPRSRFELSVAVRARALDERFTSDDAGNAKVREHRKRRREQQADGHQPHHAA